MVMVKFIGAPEQPLSVGVTVTVPDIDAFKEKVQSAYLADAAMTANWDMDLYKKIQELEK